MGVMINSRVAVLEGGCNVEPILHLFLKNICQAGGRGIAGGSREGLCGPVELSIVSIEMENEGSVSR